MKQAETNEGSYYWHKTQLKKCEFKNLNWVDLYIDKCDIQQTIFSNSNYDNGEITSTTFKKCVFNNIQFDKLINCSFNDIIFKNMGCRRTLELFINSSNKLWGNTCKVIERLKALNIIQNT